MVIKLNSNRAYIKYALCFFILFFNITSSNAQLHGVNLAYNDIHAGRNFSLGYSYKHKQKHIFNANIHFFINKLVHDNNNNVFYKRFYTFSADQTIGFDLGYKYLIPIKKLKSELFIFYEMQETYAQTRRKSLFFLGIDNVTGDEIYFQKLIITDRILALESTIGVGLNSEIYNNLFFNIKGGLGIINLLLIPTTNNMNNPNDHTAEESWSFTHVFSVGLTYFLEFKKKKKST